MTTMQLVKRRTFALTVAASLAMGGLLVASAPATNAASSAAATDDHVEPQAVTQTVVVPGGPCGDPVLGTNCQAYFPDLVKDPHGDANDLLMVYRWSSAHSKMPSQLRMMRSTDGGATWAPATPFVVADYSDVDYRDPSLSVITKADGTKRLLLSYFVSDGQTAAIIQTQVKRRDTATGAYSAPVAVYSSTIPYPATSAKIVQTGTGQLLIPLYGTPSGGGTHDAVIVASTDYGATWDGRLTGRQKTIASGSLYYQEPALAVVGPGHVRAIVRAQTAVGPSVTTNAVQTDSYDNTYMTSWDTPHTLGVMMHGPEILTIPGTSYVPYLWSQPNAASSPTNRPTMIGIRRGNVSWADTPKRVLYDPGVTNDSGYPGTVALNTNQLVTVVYDEARRAAIALRYIVSDVD